jgi:hypothetical protein
MRRAPSGLTRDGGVTETRDFSDQIKRVDAGVSFGAGATFDRFLVEGRWTEGLRDAESGDRFATAVRHRVLAVLAGFRFYARVAITLPSWSRRTDQPVAEIITNI